MGKDVQRAAGLNDAWNSENLTLTNGTIKDFYLPMPSHLLSEIYIVSLKGDLVLHLHLNGNIAAEGSGDVTVNSMSFITNTVSLSEKDALIHKSIHKNRIFSTHYIEPTRISTNNITLTREQEHRDSLEDLNRAYSYILCAIRATGTTSKNDGYGQFVSLRPRGLLDIKSSGNSSLLGSGNAVPERYLR